ncbi:PREDICTED: uncharacterized protein LOC109211227 [Nicotiana attenuata]|uniref:S-protein homolog n=1 Tax=Nicotiana attenuata TaxID=49451 RepID=A0A314KK18_NICAT|nr:PREDICTED: uncharacterized protein LOC109211227 [Nicotiana attenuata]OIT29532.1 hypothetical protein A4A49_38809 [Nicotiana attenuata]
MPSSSHYLVICFFLLSFLAVSSVNSQSPVHYPINVIVKNETPRTASARCYIHGIDARDKFIMTPGHIVEFYMSIIPGEDNTLSCDVKLGEKHGFFELFNLNNSRICHTPDVYCYWNVHEDGLCMFVAGKCVLFKWDANSTVLPSLSLQVKDKLPSIRHTASEKLRYAATGPFILKTSP